MSDDRVKAHEPRTGAPVRAGQIEGRTAPRGANRVAVDPHRAGEDLGRLVLALLEFLRQVLEHQAVRRFEAGSLTEEEEERLGLGLLHLHEKMAELKSAFGLSDEDLQLDLGPLGRLI